MIHDVRVIIFQSFYDQFYYPLRNTKNTLHHSMFALPVGIFNTPLIRALTACETEMFFALLAYLPSTNYSTTETTIPIPRLNKERTRTILTWYNLIDKLQSFQYLILLERKKEREKERKKDVKTLDPASHGASPSAPSQGGASASAKEKKNERAKVLSEGVSRIKEITNGLPTDLVAHYMDKIWNMDEASAHEFMRSEALKLEGNHG